MNFCPMCGTPVNGMNFCIKCGFKLVTDEPAMPSVSQIAAEEVVESATPPAPEEVTKSEAKPTRVSKRPKSETDDIRKFTGPLELHKAVNTLRGIVAGITTDSTISQSEVDELSNWCLIHEHLINKHPFNELIPMIERAYSDQIITTEEAEDIVWLCNNFVSEGGKYDLVTSGLQFLSGLLHGILSDNEISDSEVHALQEWLSTNEYLMGNYPFDEIRTVIYNVLDDGKVDDSERDYLKAVFSSFIDLTESYNIDTAEIERLKEQYSVSGICTKCDAMDFENGIFCFTGDSYRASRKEIAELISEKGGIFKSNLTQKTNYLIVGINGSPCWTYSCYGRKVEQAVDMRKNGKTIQIVSEVDFWKLIDEL